MSYTVADVGNGSKLSWNDGSRQERGSKRKADGEGGPYMGSTQISRCFRLGRGNMVRSQNFVLYAATVSYCHVVDPAH